ncbi:hypothetical protein ANTQUA_LOCUS64 [Anthophora quadrimaculata]
MDYDEWTPLGRGDPLKNNPTFDYVPPVLDRVQYWLDSHTTEPSAKRDILVLGVTAKKTSPKIPEQFLKFVDGPKFTRSSHKQEVSYRNDFTGSTGAEPPKIVRTSNFRNGPIDYRNQNRIQSIPASYYPSPFYSEKTKPYTMMVPPPLSQGKEKIVSFVEPTQQQFNTQTEEGPVLRESQFYAVPPPSKGYIGQQHPGKLQPQNSSKYPLNNSPIQTVSQVETIKSVYGGPSSVQPIKSKYESVTTPSVSFEKSNLIYQSTQTLAGGWPSGSHDGAPPSTPSTYHHASQYTRPTSDYSLDQYETIDHHAAASANHEVVVEQNANIIVDGNSNENEEVVLGQKGPASSNTFSSATATTSATTTTTITTTTVSSMEANTEAVGGGESSEKMHIVVANSLGNLDAAETSSSSQEGKQGVAVAVVMPSNYSEKKSGSSERPTETTGTGTGTGTGTATTDLPDHWWSTMEAKATRENASKIESNASIRNSVTGSSPIVFPEASQPVFHKQHASLAAHSTMPAAGPSFSSRHPADSLLAFGPPQPPLSSMLHRHAQPRPNHQHHASMHFLGSMRPSLGFRAPASMPMFPPNPPMTHMHAPPPPPPPPPPPITSTIDHRHVASSSMITDQSTAHRSSPQQQHISGVIVNSPTPTSSTAVQPNGGPPEDRFSDRHRPRLPDTTTSIYTTPTVPPFLPTAVSPSLGGNSSVPVARENGEEAKDEAEGVGGEEGQRKKVFSSEHASTSPHQITTVPSLTTDPIFSHYKQPAKPIRGPMYLIIQGHSKVKTYKPTVSKHSVPVERNEIGGERGQISEFEQFVQENTRGSSDPTHGNSAAVETTTTKKKKKKAEEMQRAEKLARARQNDLMSLVQSGLGSLFTVSPSSSSSSTSSTSTTTEDERQANSVVTTIEINGN